MKKATVKLMQQIFETLKPPPNRTLSQWADEYRRLSPESSAEPGRWQTTKAPYQREIMDAVSDIHTQKVIVMSAAQTGKTDAFVMNTIGYYMHYDPSPIMVLEPTIQMAEATSKDRLSPMLRDTPVLNDKVNDKSRNSGNTILQKLFPGGHVTLVGANSPASLASRPIRILLADEVDRYPPSAGNEGDPLMLAMKRLTTFWNKKIVCVSTPTIKGISRIEAEYEHSTQETWHIPCPQCGALQELKWANIIFDKNDLSVISHSCDSCGAVSPETEWKRSSAEGKYIAKHPDRKTRGFHLNALASLFVPWSEIVEKFLLANDEKKKGNIQPLKVWTNTEMGECWEEEGSQMDENELYSRREIYDCEVPEDVLVLTCGVDTQDDRFELEIVGWGVEKENWGIRYMKIYGDPKQEEIWEELDRVLDQTFTRADGAKMKIACACIDSGGHFATEVYRFCKKRTARNIFAIKGRGGADVPYISKPTTSNRVKAPLFTIGVDTGKSLLYQRLEVDEPGPNYCHFPAEEEKGYDEEYFKGLTSEKMVLTYKKGVAQYIWVKKTAHARNEPFDCRDYASAAVEILNPPLILKSRVQTGRKTGRKMKSKGVS